MRTSPAVCMLVMHSHRCGPPAMIQTICLGGLNYWSGPKTSGNKQAQSSGCHFSLHFQQLDRSLSNVAIHRQKIIYLSIMGPTRLKPLEQATHAAVITRPKTFLFEQSYLFNQLALSHSIHLQHNISLLPIHGRPHHLKILN